MNYLAIDTSGNHLTVVVKIDDKYYTEFSKDCNLKHSVTLMPTVERLILKSGKTLSDLDFYACSVGAGSFTGIRIGVSTVKALSFATAKPVLKVTSFDILAYNYKDTEKVLSVIDAKHDHYYVAGYNAGKLDLGPSYVDKDELKALSKTYTLVSSDDVDGFTTEKSDLEKGLIIAVESKLNEVTSDRETLIPVYVRKSQAEEGR